MAGTAIANITEARANLSRILDDVANEQQRVIIRKGNIAVAALVPVTDLDKLERQANRSDEIKLHILMEEIGRYDLGLPDVEEFETRQAILQSRAELRAEQKSISLGEAFDELIAERREMKRWTNRREGSSIEDPEG